MVHGMMGSVHDTRLLALRLRHHRLAAPARTVAAAAAHMLATQTQEFWGGRWALAVRSSGAPTMRSVDAAFDDGTLVRSWTMRGALHITPAEDVRWMLGVTGERMLRSARKRHAELGLDAKTQARAETVLVQALRGGGALSRAEAFAVLAAGGVDPAGQRGYHLLFTLAARALICWGPVVARSDGPTREQRIVLVDEWIPRSSTPADPLAEFFTRYIIGHGPAGVADFAWWAGLPLGMARQAADAALASDGVKLVPGDRAEGESFFIASSVPRAAPSAATTASSPRDQVHALPPFDEYYLSYANREGVCAPEFLPAIGPGKNGMVRPVLVSRGEVVGTWSQPKASDKRGVMASAELFRGDEVDMGAVSAALERFTAFRES